MTLEAKILATKKDHPEWGRERLARACGCPPAKVQRTLNKTKADCGTESLQQTHADGLDVFTSFSEKIRTLDDLLRHTKVDLTRFKVEKYVVNKWEVGSRLPDGRIVTAPLFQVKAWLREKVQENNIRAVMTSLLDEFQKAAPKRITASKAPKRGENLFEVSIFDLHLGKLCWGEEVGCNYDSAIARTTFLNATESLLQRVKGFDIYRILLPIGNDFFNVDNTVGTTTAGTRQDEDGRWQKAFVLGRKMMVEAIDRLREVAPVDIVVVPGNHDTERTFYLGEVLSAWFSRTADVKVDNRPTARKYVHFGECLIGFTHGDKERHRDLPLLMATEVPDLFAASKFREFHLGHWHSKRETVFQPVSDKRGVRVRVIPSLCPADAWHYGKGYGSLRAAEAFIWNRSQGNIARFSYHDQD